MLGLSVWDSDVIQIHGVICHWLQILGMAFDETKPAYRQKRLSRKETAAN